MSGPFARVYYSVRNDERFATVYDNDTRFAWWVRLLIAADAIYPAPADIPVEINRAALKHLVDVGLIELVGRGRYRIHGMKSERDRRSAAGQSGAAMRWGNAVPQSDTAMRDANGTAMLARDQPASQPAIKSGAHARPQRRRSKDPEKNDLEALGDVLRRATASQDDR